jgi:hypothetical protein
MTQKPLKKLVLSKETVQQLTRLDAISAAGATVSIRIRCTR